jgi:PAS domain-containing protein
MNVACASRASRRRRCLLMLEALEGRALLSGNLLVSGEILGDGSKLAEYTQDGTLVNSRDIVLPAGSDTTARGLTVGSSGDVHIYTGTFTPILATYAFTANSWSYQSEGGWSTANVLDYGQVAAYKTFVFASDMATAGAGAPSGIVRFDTAGGMPVRFADGTDFTQVAMGLDGALYGVSGRTLHVYNADTLAELRIVTLSGGPDSEARSVAVNGQGQIFATTLGGYLVRYDANGQYLAHTELRTVGGSLEGGYSISLDRDGQIAVSAASGNIHLTDEAFSPIRRISTNISYAFVTFAHYLQPEVPVVPLPPPAAGDGQVFFLDDVGQLWRYRVSDGIKTASGGYGIAIAVANVGNGDPGDDVVFLRDSTSRVWLWTQHSWMQTGGWLPELHVGDNQVFGIGFDGQLWQFNVQTGWHASGGYGAAIDIANRGDGDPANDVVFLRSADGRIWDWNQHAWNFTGGWLDTIRAGDDQVFGIGFDGQLWRYRIGVGWTASGGYGVAIDVANIGDGDATNDVVFLRNADNQLWTWNRAAWQFTGGYLKTIRAGDGQVFGLGGDGQVWRYRIGGGWTASGGWGIELDVGTIGNANPFDDLAFRRAADQALWVWTQATWRRVP